MTANDITCSLIRMSYAHLHKKWGKVMFVAKAYGKLILQCEAGKLLHIQIALSQDIPGFLGQADGENRIHFIVSIDHCFSDQD